MAPGSTSIHSFIKIGFSFFIERCTYFRDIARLEKYENEIAKERIRREKKLALKGDSNLGRHSPKLYPLSDHHSPTILKLSTNTYKKWIQKSKRPFFSSSLVINCQHFHYIFMEHCFKKTFANIFLIGFRIFGLSHEFFCRAAIFSISAGFNGK